VRPRELKIGLDCVGLRRGLLLQNAPRQVERQWDWDGPSRGWQNRHQDRGAEHGRPHAETHRGVRGSHNGQRHASDASHHQRSNRIVDEQTNQSRGCVVERGGHHDFCLLRAAIIRARRSSCPGLSTALSTMPMTSCSADPPQNRSMMLHRSCRDVLALVGCAIAVGSAVDGVRDIAFFEPAQHGPHRESFIGESFPTPAGTHRPGGVKKSSSLPFALAP
jgi:hypothetical protein